MRQISDDEEGKKRVVLFLLKRGGTKKRSKSQVGGENEKTFGWPNSVTQEKKTTSSEVLPKVAGKNAQLT